MFTKNFGVKAVTKTSVLLTWEVPETYKSQVPLKVSSALSADRKLVHVLDETESWILVTEKLTFFKSQ